MNSLDNRRHDSMVERRDANAFFQKPKGYCLSGAVALMISVAAPPDKGTEPDTISWQGGVKVRLSTAKSWQYVLLYIFRNCDTVNQLYYCDLSTLPNGIESYKGKREALPFIKLVEKIDASYDYVAHNGTIFTFQTNKDAPKYILVRVDVENPDFWFDIMEEDVLQSAVAVNENQLVVSYLRDVKNVVQLRDLETGALLHHLPID
ncbi:hypothetical protein RND71_031642 [Anisodus tanguticus]|uniref:Peptidase S9A N-terminal domain-containing protein n=1 Tax=Anisodus tanguticus TaxID=243964 RepID=A0AAE1RDY4_9SOLA|nr:hypothetical protein RND71_031642 [Anisodus tanguticus]